MMATAAETKKEGEKGDEVGFEPPIVIVPKVHQPPSASTPKQLPSIIKYRGLMDFDGFYKMMVKWFKMRKFDFNELLYKDKPPELELEWLARRKATSYIRQRIHVYFHFWDIKDVEVVKNGEKKKMLDGRVIITFSISLEFDYGSLYTGMPTKWSTSEFKRRLLTIFTKYIIKQDLDFLYADPLYYEMLALASATKDFLNMGAAGHAYG